MLLLKFPSHKIQNRPKLLLRKLKKSGKMRKIALQSWLNILSKMKALSDLLILWFLSMALLKQLLLLTQVVVLRSPMP